MDAPKLTIRRARRLRRTLTLPEVLLWSALRGRRLAGVRFRRQHPIGPYILDFYCDEARLAVEVDGEQHGHAAQSAHDRRRTDWLARRGVTVLRLAARDVLEEMAGALERIEAEAVGAVGAGFDAQSPRPQRT